MSLRLLVLFPIMFICYINTCIGQEMTAKNNLSLDELKKLGIYVDVDQTINIVSTRPVEDFIILTFFTSKEILRAYVGNHPNFPGATIPTITLAQRKAANGLRMTCYEWEEKGLFSGECLVNLSNSKIFPQYIHFGYSSLEKAEKQMAHKIIMSVKLQTPNPEKGDDDY